MDEKLDELLGEESLIVRIQAAVDTAGMLFFQSIPPKLCHHGVHNIQHLVTTACIMGGRA